MCCLACLDKYRCNAGEKKTVVADLLGNKLHSLYSRVPNKRGGGENNRGGGWKWLDITIIGGLE